MTELMVSVNQILVNEASAQMVYIDPNAVSSAAGTSTTYVVFDEPTQVHLIEVPAIVMSGGSGSSSMGDVPFDNKIYLRKDRNWVELTHDLFPSQQDTYLYGKVDEFDQFKIDGTGLGTDPNDKFVTVNDLIDAGIVLDDSGNIVKNGPKVEAIPPAPTGLVTSGGIASIRLRWVPATSLYLNHGLTQVWRSTSNDRNTAVKIFDVVTHNEGEDLDAVLGTTYFYWIKFVSIQGNTGPFNGTVGTSGVMADSADQLINQISNSIRASELYQDLLAPIGELNGKTDGLLSVTAAQAITIANEAVNRSAAIAAESQARVEAIQEAENNRILAVAIEAQARADALLDEATARGAAITEITEYIDTQDESLATQIETVTAAVGANAAAIQNEVTARTTAVAAEATSRNTLAARIIGTGNPANLSEVSSGLLYESKQSVADLEGSLVQQMALLSAGSSNQFDYAKIWYFDSGIESWWGNSTPTSVNGWLRPPPISDPYCGVSLNPNIDGTKYPQVRARIRKVGNPTWYGHFSYLTPADQGWGTNGKTLTIGEPEFDSDNIANITWNLSGLWTSSQITNFLYVLSVAATSSDYYEVDWIAVGRPSPGASSADLLVLQSATTSADSALSQSIANLTADVNGKASGSALSALTVRVTTVEGNTTAAASDIVALKTQLPGGANLIKSDTEFELTNPDNSAIGWHTISDGTVSLPYKNHAGAGYTPVGFDQIGCNGVGQSASYIDLRSFITIEECITVVQGKRYCFSAYAANHRCSTQIIIVWYNEAGTQITPNTEAVGVSAGGGTALNAFAYNYAFGTPPAGATRAGIIFRGYRDLGQSDPYIWLCQPMFCEVTTSATKPPLYTPSLAGPFAAVAKEAISRSSADELMASDITNLELELGVAGSATASTGLIARTNKATADIGDTAALNTAGFSTLVSAFTSLKAVLGTAAAGAFSALSNLVSNIDGRVTTQATDIVNLTTQQNINSVVQNPQFNPWVGSFPGGWNQWGSAPTKYLGTNAVQFNVTSGQDAGLQQPVQNYAYIDVELTFMLVSGSLGGAGIHVQWLGSLGNAFGDYRLADYYMSVSDIYGKKITASFRIKRPATFAGTFVDGYVFLMGNYAGLSPATTKNIVFYSCIMTNAGTSAEALETLDTAVNHTSTGLVATSNKVLNLESVMTANLIPGDTDFSTGLGGWNLGYNDSNGGGAATLLHHTNSHVQPPDAKTLELHNPSATYGSCSAYIDVPVTPGARYCFSAYLSAYRCHSQLLILWLNNSGGWFATTWGTVVVSNNANSYLSNYFRASLFETAPVGAVSARLSVFCTADPSYGIDPYVFFARPMFSEVGVNTTQIPAYRVNGTNAKLQVVASTVATLGGATSVYSVKLGTTGNNKKYMAGFAISTSYDVATGEGLADFGINANRFFITNNGAGDVEPFIVDNIGNVYINSAVIKDASIDSAKITDLSVSKLTGDTAYFVKLNVGTLIVDDIGGDSNLLYTLSSTEALQIGNSAGSAYGAEGGSAPVGWINIPARTNSRAYGLQFFVQGSVLKDTAGTATITAEFFTANSGAAAGSVITKSGYFHVGANGFDSVIVSSNPNDQTPADWSNFTIGSVVTIYLNSSNYIEGIVEYKSTVSHSPYTNTYVKGTAVSLREVIKIGSIPADGSGCTLYVKNVSQRYYKKLGISLSTTINTVNASQSVKYNMSYLDTSAKTTAGVNVLCVLSHVGIGPCTNQSVNFTLVSAR